MLEEEVTLYLLYLFIRIITIAPRQLMVNSSIGGGMGGWMDGKSVQGSKSTRIK